eukprot:m.341788 g.341788  ORF g.341788 m.341788 type:complete len:656 (+) comp20509_c0_seq1:89-2056(+)
MLAVAKPLCLVTLVVSACCLNAQRITTTETPRTSLEINNEGDNNAPNRYSNYDVYGGYFSRVFARGSTVGSLSGLVAGKAQMVRHAVGATTFSVSIWYEHANRVRDGTQALLHLVRGTCNSIARSGVLQGYQDPSRCPLAADMSNSCSDTEVQQSMRAADGNPLEAIFRAPIDTQNKLIAVDYPWYVHIPAEDERNYGDDAASFGEYYISELQRNKSIILYDPSDSGSILACADLVSDRTMEALLSTASDDLLGSSGQAAEVDVVIDRTELGTTHLFVSFSNLREDTVFYAEAQVLPCISQTDIPVVLPGDSQAFNFTVSTFAIDASSGGHTFDRTVSQLVPAGLQSIKLFDCLDDRGRPDYTDRICSGSKRVVSLACLDVVDEFPEDDPTFSTSTADLDTTEVTVATTDIDQPRRDITETSTTTSSSSTSGTDTDTTTTTTIDDGEFAYAPGDGTSSSSEYVTTTVISTTDTVQSTEFSSTTVEAARKDGEVGACGYVVLEASKVMENTDAEISGKSGKSGKSSHIHSSHKSKKTKRKKGSKETVQVALTEAESMCCLPLSMDMVTVISNAKGKRSASRIQFTLLPETRAGLVLTVMLGVVGSGTLVMLAIAYNRRRSLSVDLDLVDASEPRAYGTFEYAAPEPDHLDNTFYRG